jgi:hypothetical protein
VANPKFTHVKLSRCNPTATESRTFATCLIQDEGHWHRKESVRAGRRDHQTARVRVEYSYHRNLLEARLPDAFGFHHGHYAGSPRIAYGSNAVKCDSTEHRRFRSQQQCRHRLIFFLNPKTLTKTHL